MEWATVVTGSNSSWDVATLAFSSSSKQPGVLSSVNKCGYIRVKVQQQIVKAKQQANMHYEVVTKGGDTVHYKC